MLQEATNIISSAFHDSFIKRLSLYLHDCVREEVQSSTFRNLKQDKDNKWIFLQGEEELFTNFGSSLKLDGADPLLTELMIQSEMSQKDKYLIYGYLFLVGKGGRNKRANEFLTPLLYMSAKLDRVGKNIECSVQDEVLSLNTGALTALMNKSDDEDEMEHLLDGLLEVVPELPLTEEKMDIFLTTLRSIVPDIELKLDHEDDAVENNVSKDETAETPEEINFDNLHEVIDEEETPKPKKVKIEKVCVTNQSAIILTKRPQVTAGVLHELTQISEKPSGVFRETALATINEEYMRSNGKMSAQTTKPPKSLEDFVATTPLSLSDSQENVIKSIEENTIVSVAGPPGTGKSQTIVNLVAHLIANGKTVLVASRMDKATDVVAERLNSLGAPFLALRAGRANYQKQLNFQLQDLLNNKVELDKGYDNAILVDVDDMYDLVSTIRDNEKKCEEIINLENDWRAIIEEKEQSTNELGKNQFINKKLKKDELELISNLIKKLEKDMEKSGFFANLFNKLRASKLKKTLKISEFDVCFEDMERLKRELETESLACKARLVEAKIHKIGNMHQLLENIRNLKRKQAKLAVEILRGKRREALKGLLRDQVKRQRLFVHAKSLVARKRQQQTRLLETEDFKPLMEAFPCWCVTTYAISGSLPMKPGLFDVAIIDEASQCDIASCFPILFRAKKAVIVGDDKQLPHLSFLEKAKEQSFLSQYNIPDKYQLMWRFRTNSMFDLANYYATSPIMLDEHFRSLPPIIEFSNQEFYGGRIRIMKKNSNKNDVLELCLVPDGKVDYDTTRNMPETEAVIKRMHELILEDEKSDAEPVSIGVVSPFRGQVDQIKKAIMQVFSENIIRKHKIEVGTAHTFQGDEKDIMIISWCVADNSYTQSLTFMQKPNLFNVAITRARKKLICFLSKDPKSLPEGLLRDYIEYIQNYINKANPTDKFDENVYKNSFEKEVAKTLRAEGLHVIAGVETAGFSTDLTVDDSEGHSILVEIDGVDDNIKTYNTNMKKHAILERCGLKIVRVTYREWHYSPTACVERIKSALFN